MGFQMIFAVNRDRRDGLIRGVMPASRIVRMKSGRTGQIRKPLSDTTIQENALLGNRISPDKEIMSLKAIFPVHISA